MPDRLEWLTIDPPGHDVSVVDLDDARELTDAELDAAAAAARDRLGVTVGIARRPLDPRVRGLADALTTSLMATDGGPAGVVTGDVDAALAGLLESVAGAPHAAAVLAQVLRLVADLDVERAIWAESLAYSTLLGGDEFRRWRAARPLRDRPPSTDAVLAEIRDGVLHIVLNRPERRNALDAAARGALSDVLDAAIADPSVRIELRGAGPAFCSGGDLDEFGTQTDLTLAHVLRMQAGPAIRVARLADRTTAFVHGACVGAGIELPAFVRRVVAAPGSTFRLPEVVMGLIPGAGGTVSVTRRIGRWRAAWWMLSGAVLDLDRAVAWGLVDDVR